MAEADADFFLRCHFHYLLYFRQYLAVFATQAHAFVVRMTGATPEAVRSKCREPDHLEVGILQADADVFGPHAETHADAAINLDPVGELAAGDHVVDVALR